MIDVPVRSAPNVRPPDQPHMAREDGRRVVEGLSG